MGVRPRRRRGSIGGAAHPRPKSSDEDDADEYVDDTDEKDDSKPKGIRHEATTDREHFKEAGSALIEKLYNALKPMEKFNDTFILTRGVEDDVGEFLLLDIGPVHGQYTVQVDVEQTIVLLVSPISGQFAYVLSNSTGEWVGRDDGHSLEGMLVRDLIRQCNGVPKL